MANRSRVRHLIAVNGVLLAVLALVALVPDADGQQNRRARGTYTMVSAQVQGFSEDALYLVDGSNREIVVLRYERSRKRLSFVGYRDMAQDSEQRRGRSR